MFGLLRGMLENYVAAGTVANEVRAFQRLLCARDASHNVAQQQKCSYTLAAACSHAVVILLLVVPTLQTASAAFLFSFSCCCCCCSSQLTRFISDLKILEDKQAPKE
jgi:hypothetical protein